MRPEVITIATSVHRRRRNLAVLSLFALVLAGMTWRLHQHWPAADFADAARWSLADFRDVIYFPVRAVADGVNPYDTTRDDPQRYLQRYPALDILPLYSPTILLLLSPLALLPVDVAMVAFAGLNLILFVTLAWITIRAIGRRASFANVLGLATLLLISQPGRGLFFAGQLALPLALATAGALRAGDRRGWKCGALVAFSTFKPTFGGPLGLLLLARRDWRSSLGGLALGGMLGLLGMIVIFARSGALSAESMLRVIGQNQASFDEDPMVLAENNKARIDLGATIEYLTDRPAPAWRNSLITCAVLGLTGWTLWRTGPSRDAPSAISATSALLMAGMMLCVFHNVYDLPLLVLPIAGCASAAHPSWRCMAPVVRWTALCLLLVPFVNLFWTEGFRYQLERIGIHSGENGPEIARGMIRLATAANGIALASAWALLNVSLRRRRSADSFVAPRVGVASRAETASVI